MLCVDPEQLARIHYRQAGLDPHFFSKDFDKKVGFHTD